MKQMKETPIKTEIDAQLLDEISEEELIVGKLLTERNSIFSKPATIAYATFAFAVVFVLMSMIFSPFAENIDENDSTSNSSIRVPVWERGSLDYVTTGDNGYVMEEGTYQQLETANEWNSTHVFVDFELPLSEGGAAPNGMISLAYWLPDVPEGTKVPIIAEIGPYFQEPSVQTPTIEVPGSWLGEMIIEQHLPHGYGFAQISVTGTGRSNHCMDLWGLLNS